MKLTVDRFYGHLNVIRSVPVRDLMDPPIMISKDVALSKILPVVDNGRLVGIITSSDIMKVMLPSERISKKSVGIDNAEDRFSIEVSGLANADMIIAKVDESLQVVCDRMMNAGSTYCIIRVWDEIQGIITYRDIVALLGERWRKIFQCLSSVYPMNHSTQSWLSLNLQISPDS